MLKIEKGLRLPSFRLDVPITLGNGEAFHFRPPTVQLYPVFDAMGRMSRENTLNYGEEWLEKLREAESRMKDDPEHCDITEFIMWFADRMLLENYKKDIRRHYKQLLSFSPRDPACLLRYSKIWLLAGGADPKEMASAGS